MATTDFKKLPAAVKTVWSRDLWKAARDMAFITKFTGTGQNAVIQRITELTKTEKGSACVIQLVADLVGDGQIGDNEREGQEEALQNYSQTVNIDLLTNSVKNKGKLSDQSTVINFRENAKDTLAFWLANRLDQLAFLTLAGVSYSKNNDGSDRVGSNFPALAFAADVAGPSSKRALMFNGTDLIPSVTANITSSYVPTYKMLVKLGAYAKTHYVRPIVAGGKSYYVLFVHPLTLSALKQDADYQRAMVTGMPRGADNPFFTGASVTIDGLIIHEHNLVYNTLGAAGGSKWGGGAVDGSSTILCGSQALAMADLGIPEWNEKTFQYGSQSGINVDKMVGFLKPKFYSIYDKSVQDFGVVTVDHYIN